MPRSWRRQDVASRAVLPAAFAELRGRRARITWRRSVDQQDDMLLRLPESYLACDSDDTETVPIPVMALAIVGEGQWKSQSFIESVTLTVYWSVSQPV